MRPGAAQRRPGRNGARPCLSSGRFRTCVVTHICSRHELLPMHLTPLAPATRPDGTTPRWSAAASTVLHLAAVALVIGIAARQPPPPGAGSPSFDLVFEAPSAQPDQAKPPGLPPIQPADIPVPDDAPLGTPAPAAMSPPQPDGLATPLPEAASAPAAPASAPAPEPAEVAPPVPAVTSPPAAPPTKATAEAPRLAFAPPIDPAVTAEPTPADIRPNAPPTVNLRQPSQAAERSSPLDLTPIMPQPPKPLPPEPPRSRPRPPTPSRQALGTLSNPMDLSFAPSAPRPAARGSVASRAFDLSPPPERQGASRSDPYAQIRAANASEDWNRGLLQFWLRHRFYPPQAAQSGEEGTVTIQLTVDRSGRVDNVEIVSRSGSQWLDMAAVATFRNARLPPFTNEMRQDRLTFPIPITYYLVRH